ncbi:sensor histidine kinase [Microbacterium laevaniformans]|uniref:histidine kinase n=1 Tax=Microbacterium laevaniformans TaxID=36807 RepID=A0A4S2DDR3_9MICO|nr:histidine kinase [Microbacterium laevaniformans]TGY39542.1 sensor histidine kinase [Microbacterium laevaniformans]
MFRTLTRTQLTVDIVAAGVFAMFAVLATLVPWDSVSSGVLPPRVALAVALVLTVVFSAAGAIRRLAPELALAVCWVAAIMQMASGLPPLPANVVIFGVLYTAAAYGARRTFWFGLASSLVGAFAIAAYIVVVPLLLGAGTPNGIGTYVFASVATFASAAFALLLSWTTGALVRTTLRARENRRAQELAEATAVAEAERTRIARDMHDVVAHSLAVVIAQADGARYAAASDPAVAAATLGTISATARAALSDVRMLLTQLRHTQAQGPQPTLADLEQLYAQVRAAGVALRVDVDPMPAAEVPSAVQLAVFRILQEALTNALRHGARSEVSVRLAWHPGRVELTVSNPIDPPSPLAGAHGDRADGEARGHGLIGMRERAQLVGGHLEASPRGRVFVVSASLPIAAEAMTSGSRVPGPTLPGSHVPEAAR